MHILYIEDDATNRTVLREMLGAVGVTLAEADNARTGLEMIERDLRWPPN